jgi:hypothetical protein
MRAFIRAFARECCRKPLEAVTLAIGTVTVIVLMWQLHDLDRTLESQAYNAITVGLLELDKISVEKSEYRVYFVGDAPLPTEPAERQKLWSLADAKLDFIDGFYSQEDHINWTRYTKRGWEEYFKESFRCGAVIRTTYCRDQTQYGSRLQAFTFRAFPGGICNGPNPKTLAQPGQCNPDR